MKYNIEKTNKFAKQYAKVLKQKEFKEEEFIKVLTLLANDEILPPKYKNHLLKVLIMVKKPLERKVLKEILNLKVLIVMRN